MVHKCGSSYCTHGEGFADASYADAFGRIGSVGKMGVQFFGQVSRCDGDVGDAGGGQCVNVVVDDGSVAHVQQRLGRVVGERAQPLAFASGHKYGADGQTRGSMVQVYNT